MGYAVKCSDNSDGSNTPQNVYRYANGVLRCYNNPTTADECDADWRNWQYIDCTGIPIGAQLQEGDCLITNAPSKIPSTIPSEVPSQSPSSGAGEVLYSDLIDTKLWEKNPNTAYGSITGITVDQNDGGKRTQALVKAPSLAIPDGKTLVSASLTFYTNDVSSGTISAYRMTQSWDESSTWNSFGGDGVTPGDGTASFPFLYNFECSKSAIRYC